MFKYYNPNLIVSCKSYTVDQICKLYAAKKLHAQTIRQWVKSGELEAVSNRPILIYGEVLKSFIEARNKAHKRTLEFNQFKCVKCREVSPPKGNAISVYQNKNGSLKAVGICPACNHQNFRFYKRTDRSNLEKMFVFNTPHVTTICDGLVSSTKTHLNNNDKPPSNEPLKKDIKNERKLASKTHLNSQQLSLLDFGGSTP
jgi:Zn finger protein HypA/HybF involved in hydrogenase expression